MKDSISKMSVKLIFVLRAVQMYTFAALTVEEACVKYSIQGIDHSDELGKECGFPNHRLMYDERSIFGCFTCCQNRRWNWRINSCEECPYPDQNPEESVAPWCSVPHKNKRPATTEEPAIEPTPPMETPLVPSEQNRNLPTHTTNTPERKPNKTEISDIPVIPPEDPNRFKNDTKAINTKEPANDGVKVELFPEPYPSTVPEPEQSYNFIPIIIVVFVALFAVCFIFFKYVSKKHSKISPAVSPEQSVTESSNSLFHQNPKPAFN